MAEIQNHPLLRDAVLYGYTVEIQYHSDASWLVSAILTTGNVFDVPSDDVLAALDGVHLEVQQVLKGFSQAIRSK